EQLEALLGLLRRRRDQDARRVVGGRRRFVGVPVENFDELAVLNRGLAALGLAVQSEVQGPRRGVAVPRPDQLPGSPIGPRVPAGDLRARGFGLSGGVEPNAA